MESIKRLLELRRKIKSRKPLFIRQDTGKKRLKIKWRRPTGLHSKLRGRLSGRPKRIAIGYRSPRKVRGLHKSGLQKYVISSIKDLEGLDAKKIGLVISSSLGDRKRIIMLKRASELGFNVLNIKNPDEYVKDVENKINLRKTAKKKEEEKAKPVKAEKKETTKTEDNIESEEKKETEKKEKDKLLTKRDI